MAEDLKLELLHTGLTQLGENPHYCAETNHLTFVDIDYNSPKMYKLDVSTNKLDSFIFTNEKPCSSATPTNQKDKFVLTRGDEVVEFTWDGDKNEQRVVDSISRDFAFPMFINDAKADSRGRLWFASVDQEIDEKQLKVAHQASGGVYSAEFGSGLPLIRRHSAACSMNLANGLGWSPDNRVMYYADTDQRHIYAYDFDEQTGEISNQRVAVDFRMVKIRIYMGMPDGLTVDANGHLWVACLDSGWVAEFDPNTGDLLERLHIPTNRVTSCTFGGPHMNQMFITSAKRDSKGEFGGSLFRVDGFKTKGLPSNRVNFKHRKTIEAFACVLFLRRAAEPNSKD